jgi:hypothetical protein
MAITPRTQRRRTSTNWCGDHNKALEKNPLGQVAGGGPMTLPDPNIVFNGAWYSGSAYLSGDAQCARDGVNPAAAFRHGAEQQQC